MPSRQILGVWQSDKPTGYLFFPPNLMRCLTLSANDRSHNKAGLVGSPQASGNIVGKARVAKKRVIYSFIGSCPTVGLLM